jgi:hypothetical protein
MFKRRKQHPVLQRLGYLIWPRTGWSRAGLYIWHRIARLRGTPHSIAAGLASGAAVSFTPMVGIHFVLAAITGSLTRGNLIAAMIGTGVGNPWTFPFIWIWIYHLGRKILGQGDAAGNPDFLALFTGLPVFLLKMLVSFEVDIVFFHKIWVVWAPMAVGAIPTFFAAWIAAYLVTKPLLAAYQTQRIARRSRRRKRERAAREQAADDQAPNEQPRKFGSAGS